MKKIITALLLISMFMTFALIAQESEEVVQDAPDVEEVDTEKPDVSATDGPSSGATRQTGIGAITGAYEAGREAYIGGNLELAVSHFESALSAAEEFMKGIVDPNDQAQTKYYRGLALYYIGKINKNDSVLDDASSAFAEATSAFTANNNLGRFYLDSKYRRGLCSFRQYQMAKVENTQIRKLGQAWGDFRDFLEDPALNENNLRSEMNIEIEEAKYYSALCLLRRGMIKSFDPSEYSSAKTDLTTATGYFAELADAQNRQISVASRLMDGVSHYCVARLYMQVSPDNWETSKLSNKERDDAVLEELQTADTRLKAAKSSAGTLDALGPYIDFAILYNVVAQGAAGEGARLQEALGSLASMNVSGTWAHEKEFLASNVQLLRYFLGDGDVNSNTAVRSWTGLTSKDKVANYWIGWVRFIESIEDPRVYPQAASHFSSFLGSAQIDTRDAIMRADAKFREAECTFWDGTLRNVPMLRMDAKIAYESLVSASGAYARYLPEDIIKQAEIRVQIIDVLQRGDVGTIDINRIVTNLRLQGLDLPGDAAAYLNFGKFFLEKANREADQQRLRSVGLAIDLFSEVSKGSGVKAETVQEAIFLKGVGYVKKAPASADAQKPAIMQEAKGILEGVTGALATEAKYAIGVGFFNIGDMANSRASLDRFKDNYIRPAYVYAMASDACVTKGTYLRKVLASTDRSDTWHTRATQAFDGLECKSSVPSQDGSLRSIGAPITYESLADPKAQVEELRGKGRLMWQRIAAGMPLYPVDELIPDTPPTISIPVQFEIVETNGKKIDGNHLLTIGGDSEIAEWDDKTKTYRATLSRATHKVEVTFRGYYKYSEELTITEEKTVQLVLKRAVRYSRRSTDFVDGSEQPMAIVSKENQFFVANNQRRAIYRRDSGGSLIGTIFYDDIRVSAVTGLALDGDNLLIVDGRAGQVKIATVDGSDVRDIAAKGESYGGKPLLKPTHAIAVGGWYYIIDSGNSRVVAFEGTQYRDNFGMDQLERPMGIAFRSSDERFLITDIVQGKMFVFSRNGEMIESFALPNLKSPSGVFVDPDGFILVSDYVSGAVYKYTNKFEFIAEISSETVAPVAVTQIGSGPDASLYVAEKDAVFILRGAWDNAYTPSK